MTDPSSAEPPGYNAALTELETILDSLDGDDLEVEDQRGIRGDLAR